VGVGLAVALAALLAAYWGGPPGAPGVTSGAASLPRLGLAASFALIIAGAVILDFGWPLYRLTVTLVGLLVGGLVLGMVGGVALGVLGMIAGLVLGAVGGALAAWPLEPLIRGCCGALAGLLLGVLAGAVTGNARVLTILALVGPLLGGALTFLLFRPLMMTVFAVCGAALITYGGASLYAPEGERIALGPGLAALAALLAVIGVLTQRSISRRMERRGRSTPRPPGGVAGGGSHLPVPPGAG
jgi:hypothetical protein